MSDYNYHDYNCPDCNEAKLQSDKNARKINEVIDQVNALVQVNNETVDFIEERADEKVTEIAEIKVNEVLGDLRTSLDNIVTETINVKNPPNGLDQVKGDGDVDETDKIQSIINYAKNKYKFYDDNNSGYNTARIKLYFPTGIYRVSNPLDIDGTGIIIEGNGADNTVFVLTNKTSSLFYLGKNSLLYSKFTNFSCWAGEVKKRSDNLGYYIEKFPFSDSDNTSKCFDYTTTSGSTRFNEWNNIVVQGGFNKIFDIGGYSCHSENTFINCNFFHSNYLFYLNNPQAINHTFVGCSAEFIYNSVFYVKAGGYINMYGGSYINPNDFITLASGQPGVGIGTSNYNFYLNSVKWEMYQNISTAYKPKLINCVGEQIACIYMDNCNNLGGEANPSDVIANLVGSIVLVIRNSSIKGIINAEAKGMALSQNKINQHSIINIEKCLSTPTINSIGEFKYNYNYTNCIGIADYKSMQEYIGCSTNDVKKSLKTRMEIYGASGGSHTLKFLGIIIPTSIYFRCTQGGGNAGTLNIYSKEDKSVLLGTINIDTSVKAKINKLEINYNNFSTSSLSNTLVYEWKPNGNNGYCKGDVYLEYLC